MDGAIKIQPLKWKWESLKTSFIVVTIAFFQQQKIIVSCDVTHCKFSQRMSLSHSVGDPWQKTKHPLTFQAPPHRNVFILYTFNPHLRPH